MRARNPIVVGGLLAVLAAIAFGVTAPIVKSLSRDAGAFATASLLYLGSALAAIPAFGATPTGATREAPLRMAHGPRLLAAAIAGALIAPTCLAWGLQHTSAASASLLLNFETIFTVLLAWGIYREPVGRRVALAVAIMLAGGACLMSGGGPGRWEWGAVAVVAATLGWAVDNILLRPLADLDPTPVVRWKSALGALFAVVLAWSFSQPFPRLADTAGLIACGIVGYGLSLRCYLLAQRRIGAARTGSIFAVAPFVGALASWIAGERPAGVLTAVATVLFAAGVYLHLTERHEHTHTHDALEHDHAHRHDDGHHDHVHDPPEHGEHSHSHRHEARTHEHPHAPDVHHRHRHDRA